MFWCIQFFFREQRANAVLYFSALTQYFGHYNITCGVIHIALTWDDIHSVITLSFLTSETRINITNGHTPHHPSVGGSCLFVYIYSITGIKEFCQSGQENASVFWYHFLHQNGPIIGPLITIPTLTQCCRVNNAVSVKLFVWCPDNFAAACWILLLCYCPRSRLLVAAG